MFKIILSEREIIIQSKPIILEKKIHLLESELRHKSVAYDYLYIDMNINIKALLDLCASTTLHCFCFTIIVLHAKMHISNFDQELSS